MSAGSKDMLKLPVQPLLDWIEREGGLTAVLGFTSIDPWEERDEDQFDPHTSLEYKRAEKTLRTSKDRGWVGFWWADDFCCKTLGTHPLFIFGDDYLNPFQKVEEKGAQEVAA